MAAADRRRALGFPSESYWLDIGTPERYLKGTFDIIEGNVHTAVRERLGRTTWRSRRTCRSRGARSPRGARSAGCTWRQAPTSAASWCSARA